MNNNIQSGIQRVISVMKSFVEDSPNPADPVVPCNVSLTSLLRGQLVKCLMTL